MEEATSRYRCPECDRAILNRKIDKCLYCGAALPVELLLSQEAIAGLNRQQQKIEERQRQNPYQSSLSANGSVKSNWNLGDAIDVIDITGDVIDIASDLANGIGGLLE